MAKTTTKEATLKDLLKLAAEGLSPWQIKTRLNESGLTNEKGSQWYAKSVMKRITDGVTAADLARLYPGVHKAVVADVERRGESEPDADPQPDADPKPDARARIVELAATGIAPDLIWTIMSHEGRKMDNGRKWTKKGVVEVLTEMAGPAKAKAKANGKEKAKSEPSPVETWTVVVVVGHVATVRVASSFEHATQALLADETDGASARKVLPLGDVSQCLMGLDVLSVERR